jgi:hypothetical protein
MKFPPPALMRSGRFRPPQLAVSNTKTQPRPKTPPCGSLADSAPRTADSAPRTGRKRPPDGRFRPPQAVQPLAPTQKSGGEHLEQILEHKEQKKGRASHVRGTRSARALCEGQEALISGTPPKRGATYRAPQATQFAGGKDIASIPSERAAARKIAWRTRREAERSPRNFNGRCQIRGQERVFSGGGHPALPLSEEPPVTRLCGRGFSSWPIPPPANCQEFPRKIDWRIPRARRDFQELADSAPRCESRKRGGLVSMRANGRITLRRYAERLRRNIFRVRGGDDLRISSPSVAQRGAPYPTSGKLIRTLANRSRSFWF